MKFYWTACLLLVSSIGFAQVSYLPLAQSSQSARIASTTLDTIALPFWDDFSKYDRLDTTLWAYGLDAFINNTAAIQAPTRNVATFDGLNQSGLPHLAESEFNGAGDSLVSHAIDLSQVDKDDINTLYLSFYWQMKGRGDLPNDEDSLSLSFLHRDGTWVTQDISPDPDNYGLRGGISRLVFDEDSVQSFTQVIVPVTDRYQHEGFRFKFQSFTSLNGIYDTWHIDYVYLNSQRTADDLLHFDRAVSSIENALFFPYTAFPLEQLTDPTAAQSQEQFLMSNLDNSPHPARYSYQLKNLTDGSASDLSFITPADLVPLEVGRTEVAPVLPLPNSSTLDSVVLESEIVYLTGDKQLFEEVSPTGDTLFLAPDLTANDTLRTRYTLHNYLAYDDGSAELAAGINLNQGQLAVQFHVPSQDTLTDILIYFPPIFPSAVGESITVRVWSELDNFAITREFGGVIEAVEKDQFQLFTLQTPVIVRDTFFIGYQQFTDNYLGVGLDKNNNGGSDKIYSNTNREWVQNDRISGSLMIRPVFRNADEYVLSLDKDQPDLQLYPNPADEVIYFSGEVAKASIWTLSGQQLDTCTNCSSIDVRSFDPGIYLIRLMDASTTVSKRVIIR